MNRFGLSLRINTDTVDIVRFGTSLSIAFGDGVVQRHDLPSEASAELLCGLKDPEGVDETLIAEAPDAGRLQLVVQRLRVAGVIEWVTLIDGREIARTLPRTARFEPLPRDVTDAAHFDAQAYLRSMNGGLWLEAPDVDCRLALSAEAGAAVTRIMAEAKGDARAAGAEDDVDHDIRCLLRRTGFLVRESEAAGARRLWEFHDRLFHTISRPGWDDPALGPTGRFAGLVPPPPPAFEGPPRQGDLEDDLPSRPLRDLLRSRRSTRDFAPDGPDRKTLHALLSRTLRITAERRAGAAKWLERPIPAAGGLGELIGYLAVARAPDLEPGLWRHDAMADRLDKVADAVPALDRIVAETAAHIMRPEAPPPVVVVLAARQSIVAWKYEKLAYRLTLLNAGVALGVLHLVAEDLGLAGCAAGTGNPNHLARLTGIDPFTEISMAEFAVGRPA